MPTFPTATVDHPLVRNHQTCVRCQQPKDAGLLVCWPCHRKEKAGNGGGYSRLTERMIDALEATLAAQAAETPAGNRTDIYLAWKGVRGDVVITPWAFDGGAAEGEAARAFCDQNNITDLFCFEPGTPFKAVVEAINGCFEGVR